MRPILTAGLGELGLTPPADGVERLLAYAHLLVERNRGVNLTAITAPEEIATLHFLDCAGVLAGVNLAGRSLVDVGTGAGFPGLVLKILEPTIDLTLLDASRKRLEFLDEVCQTLGLEGVTILHARAEEGGVDPALRERFDYATARAVAALPLLCEMCLPYVAVGGAFLAMKAADCDDEIAAARGAAEKLGARLADGFSYRIPRCDIHRRVVAAEKIAPTPTRYPRRWAKMQKIPL